MPQLTQAEIRNNAVAFIQEWREESRERAEAQTFWNKFLEPKGTSVRYTDPLTRIAEQASIKRNQA